jgi:hypothetical protein
LSENQTELVEELYLFFERYDEEIEKAEPLFDLKGRRLEEMIRSLPYHQSHYDQLGREAQGIAKTLTLRRDKIEARLTRNYLQGQRTYGSRETAILIAGEPEMNAMNQLITEVELYEDKLKAIVEAFKQMGWMLGNVTKLRVAELHDVII